MHAINTDVDKINNPTIVSNEMRYSFFQSLDWFTLTWRSSHIRFMKIETCTEVTPPDFLVWILSRDPTNPDYSLSEWLQTCELQAIQRTDVCKYLKHAESDFEEELEKVKTGTRSNVTGATVPWDTSSFVDIEWAYKLVAEKSKHFDKQLCQKHESGQIYIQIWKQQMSVYYLEIRHDG